MTAKRSFPVVISGIILCCSFFPTSHSAFRRAGNVSVAGCDFAAAFEPSSSTADPDNQKIAPVLTPAELQQLQLLDVEITSVRQVDGQDPGQTPVNPEIPAITAAHVKVDGVIGGTIQFELLLPDEWNGRFAMGDGGFVGRVSNFIRDSVNRGYATSGTDTGHQSRSRITAAWALDNLAAHVNYGHLAIHRTALASEAIVSEYYGRSSVFSYFYGCSTGEGQALIEAQRYPDDFDGIISAAPVVQHTGLAAARLYNAQIIFPDPNQLTAPIITKQELVRHA